MGEIINHIAGVCKNALNEVILGCSAFLGVLLTAIGYPQQVLTCIFGLCIFDILTKWYSIVVVNYESFTLRRFIRAWIDKKLTSRGIKNGTCVKIILYTPVLFIAHQISLVSQMIAGEWISSVIYSLLIIIESVSILENLTDSGITTLKPILDFFKVKQDEMGKK